MEAATPEDINRVNTAGAFLGVDRDASDRKIELVFEAISENVQGETYWTAVKAQEIALSVAVADGTSTAFFENRSILRTSRRLLMPNASSTQDIKEGKQYVLGQHEG